MNMKEQTLHKGFTNILTEVDANTTNLVVKRTIEAIEIAPIAGSYGGTLVRNRTRITKVNGWLLRLVGERYRTFYNESITFIPNVTIKNIKDSIKNDKGNI